jgi:hypothetical protein
LLDYILNQKTPVSAILIKLDDRITGQISNLFEAKQLRKGPIAENEFPFNRGTVHTDRNAVDERPVPPNRVFGINAGNGSHHSSLPVLPIEYQSKQASQAMDLKHEKLRPFFKN